jgi:hypothetical protein
MLTPDLRVFAYWGNERNTSAPVSSTDGSVWTDSQVFGTLSDFNDSTSNDRDASFSGTPERNATGVSGYAIRFGNGSDDHLTISGFNEIVGSSARTIEAWIKSDQNTAPILGWGNGTNLWDLGWDAQGPKVDINSSTKRQGSGVTGNGNWNHITASYPGSNADLNATRIYLNGRLVDAPSSSNDGTVNTPSDSDLLIGAKSDSSTHLDGWMDEVRISNVSRSHGWARLSYESQRTDENFLSQDLEYLQAPVLPTDLNLTVVMALLSVSKYRATHRRPTMN